MTEPIRARLRQLVAAVAFLVAVAVACSAAGSGPGGETSRPPSTDASKFRTATPIKHVVFIIKENRSFDNMFGRFPGAEGTTMGNDHGRIFPLYRGYDQRLPHDLAHDYQAALDDYDHGKMDGFNQGPPSEVLAYTQLHGPEQLPNYWHWAKNFVLGDYFFASVNGPSFPNHLFTIAAQSGGAHDNPLPPGPHDHGAYKTWGCDAPKTEVVQVVDTEGVIHKVAPCFDFKTEGDLLTGAGIPWSYYGASPIAWDKAPYSGYIWSAYASIGHIRDNPKVWDEHVFEVQHVVGDIRADRLPPVTWITPQFALSEHPEYNFCAGENWTTKVVDAIMRSPMWKDTAIFITWDDWGGFYDHVPPPQIDKFGLGIRVPFLTISPYAKKGFIDHRHAEFSDVLRFIEDNWHLGQLTKRDRQAGNLFHEFDFEQNPRPPDTRPLRTDCRGRAFTPPPPGAYS
jgi:phospholipase C